MLCVYLLTTGASYGPEIEVGLTPPPSDREFLDGRRAKIYNVPSTQTRRTAVTIATPTVYRVVRCPPFSSNIIYLFIFSVSFPDIIVVFCIPFCTVYNTLQVDTVLMRFIAIKMAYLTSRNIDMFYRYRRV
jgi:hypothetical protein